MIVGLDDLLRRIVVRLIGFEVEIFVIEGFLFGLIYYDLWLNWCYVLSLCMLFGGGFV